MPRFHTRELAHAWAHQTAPNGTCSANESFAGPDYYSYGTVIGKRLAPSTYLLNTTGYSVSTTKHQGHVRRAIPHGSTIWTVDDVPQGSRLIYSGAELFERCIKRAAEAHERAEKARGRKGEHREAEHAALEMAREVAAFYKLRRKVDEKSIERLATAAKREKARAEKARAERQKAREAEKAADVAAWLSGEPVRFPYDVERVYLRLFEGAVETSREVRVPVEDVERAYRFALAARARGWRRNGETCPVGAYQLDSVEDSGVIAGCHRIGWDEVERFAGLMGWAS